MKRFEIDFTPEETRFRVFEGNTVTQDVYAVKQDFNTLEDYKSVVDREVFNMFNEVGIIPCASLLRHADKAYTTNAKLHYKQHILTIEGGEIHGD